ncbi:MAG: type IV pilin-like G/H family protein [Gloeotrichia echinulata DVL01]|jgi:hypothetical protein|nr:type IV pilin-like G/H family protein [Gloeotrichia echinulata DEX184]
MSQQENTAKNIGLITLGCGCGLLVSFLLPLFIMLLFIPFLPGLFKTSLQELQNIIEAQNNISQINTAQQDYFSKNNRFASNISELGLDIKSETENYSYVMTIIDSQRSVKITGKAKKPELLSYTGAVFALKVEGNEKPVTLTQICGTDAASLTPPEIPKVVGIKIECPSGSTPAFLSNFNSEGSDTGNSE